MNKSFNLTKSSKKYDVRYCIICQKGTLNDEDLSSSENGCGRIRNAAKNRKDVVACRLGEIGEDESFKFHLNNNCYKNYTHPHNKTPESLSPDVDQNTGECEENDACQIIEPPRKITR